MIDMSKYKLVHIINPPLVLCSFCGLGFGGGDYEDDEGTCMVVLYIV